MNIHTKQFQILTDIGLAWDLMTDIYTIGEDNGPAAPFFEYAVNSSWLNKDYLPMDRFWLDGRMPVAFVFYEQPVTQLHFCLRPGYECLAGEMIDYAASALPDFGKPTELVLFVGQKALIEAAQAQGYKTVWEESWRAFDFRAGRLDYPLPEGYHFVDPRNADPLKVARCLWDGFNREEHGPFQHWSVPTKNGGVSPHELYRSVLGSTLAPPPHATYDYNVIIADESHKYVCFSGMWWVEKDRLAYMEPLCTVPEHRGRGLAAAALSRHDRILRPLGAEIMTGGGNEFYKKIGFTRELRELHMRKK